MTTAADLTGYRAVHLALRRAPHRLAAAARTLAVGPGAGHRGRAAAIAKYWRGYAGEVLVHHTIEDVHMFPALVARVPVAADLIARTDDEHHHLDDLMDAIGAAVEKVEWSVVRSPGVLADHAMVLAGLFDELAAHMDGHLAFEDADILPLFERHFTQEEYAELDEAAMKSIGLGRQAAFTVPFIAAAQTPDVRTQLFAGAPAPFHVLYRLTRGRHARLERRAFAGSAVLEEVAW